MLTYRSCKLLQGPRQNVTRGSEYCYLGLWPKYSHVIFSFVVRGWWNWQPGPPVICSQHWSLMKVTYTFIFIYLLFLITKYFCNFKGRSQPLLLPFCLRTSSVLSEMLGSSHTDLVLSKCSIWHRFYIYVCCAFIIICCFVLCFGLNDWWIKMKTNLNYLNTWLSSAKKKSMYIMLLL